MESREEEIVYDGLYYARSIGWLYWFHYLADWLVPRKQVDRSE